MLDYARTMVVLGSAAIGSDGCQWVEVIPTADKARNGPWFFSITEDDLKTYAQSIASQPGLIPVDYDHSESGSTAAAGWFTGETQIVLAGEQTPLGDAQDHSSLWACVKWTPQAMQEITDGRFKRLSPEFTFQNSDKKTGLLTKANRIAASTLTNKPFFRQMAPVAAGDLTDDDIAVLAEEFGLKPSIVTRLITRVSERTTTGREAITEGAEMDTTVLAKSLGLADDATDEQITAAIAANAEKAAKADELATEVETLKGAQTAEKSELETLREQVATERKARLEGEREQILTAATSEGRMAPAERETLVEAFGENVDGLRKVLAARPKGVIAEAKGTGGGGKEGESPVSAVEAKKFENADGDPIDDESLKVHARALEILGDKKYDEDEYLAAAAQATDELHVTA